jgi:phage baseplate assembly protein W
VLLQDSQAVCTPNGTPLTITVTQTRVRGDDHIRDLIEQVLFTSPGERVNRPDFGSGLMQLVFAPNSDELATATQFMVQGALQQWRQVAQFTRGV